MDMSRGRKNTRKRRVNISWGFSCARNPMMRKNDVHYIMECHWLPPRASIWQGPQTIRTETLPLEGDFGRPKRRIPLRTRSQLEQRYWSSSRPRLSEHNWETSIDGVKNKCRNVHDRTYHYLPSQRKIERVFWVVVLERIINITKIHHSQKRKVLTAQCIRSESDSIPLPSPTGACILEITGVDTENDVRTHL